MKWIFHEHIHYSVNEVNAWTGLTVRERNQTWKMMIWNKVQCNISQHNCIYGQDKLANLLFYFWRLMQSYWYWYWVYCVNTLNYMSFVIRSNDTTASLQVFTQSNTDQWQWGWFNVMIVGWKWRNHEVPFSFCSHGEACESHCRKQWDMWNLWNCYDICKDPSCC